MIGISDIGRAAYGVVNRVVGMILPKTPAAASTVLLDFNFADTDMDAMTNAYQYFGIRGGYGTGGVVEFDDVLGFNTCGAINFGGSQSYSHLDAFLECAGTVVKKLNAATVVEGSGKLTVTAGGADAAVAGTTTADAGSYQWSTIIKVPTGAFGTVHIATAEADTALNLSNERILIQVGDSAVDLFLISGATFVFAAGAAYTPGHRLRITNTRTGTTAYNLKIEDLGP